MLRANDKAAIRSAIGVGQTDSPTFLAQTLTGQSLTGTQATSLVDLSATWNTTGNPSLIYGRVTNTNSGTTANLIDLGTFAGGSLFKVSKTGAITANSTFLLNGSLVQSAGNVIPSGALILDYANQDVVLTRDAPGILAQRNGTAKQVHRVYNTFLGTTANEWGGFDWLTTANTLRIGTEHGGTGTARPIDFVTGGVAKWQISAAGHLMSAGVTDGLYDIGASGANRPRTIYAGTSMSSPTFVSSGSLSAFGSNTQVAGTLHVGYTGSASASLYAPSNGVLLIGNLTASDFGRLCLGGTTSAFPAIKRNGTGIDIRLADDSAFAPVKGKITTDTAYTATTVVATGYITLYDSTGTAYRVPCAV